MNFGYGYLRLYISIVQCILILSSRYHLSVLIQYKRIHSSAQIAEADVTSTTQFIVLLYYQKMNLKFSICLFALAASETILIYILAFDCFIAYSRVECIMQNRRTHFLFPSNRFFFDISPDIMNKYLDYAFHLRILHLKVGKINRFELRFLPLYSTLMKYFNAFFSETIEDLLNQ